MNNSKLLIAVLVIVFLAAGGYFYLQNQSSDSMIKNEDVMTQNSQTPEKMMKEESEEGEGMMKNEDSYVPYTPEAFQTSSATRRVLFFYANWCPTCKPANEGFMENKSKIPEGVTVIRVNYNDTETDENERKLADQYGVTYQHTYVQIDSEGNEVAKWNGGGLEELLRNLK